MIRNIDMCKLYGAFAVNLMNWARARAGGWVGLFLFFRKFLENFQTLNRGFSLIEWGQKFLNSKSEEFGLEPERGSWVGLSKNFEKFLKNFKKVFEIFCVFCFHFFHICLYWNLRLWGIKKKNTCKENPGLKVWFYEFPNDFAQISKKTGSETDLLRLNQTFWGFFQTLLISRLVFA